MYPDWGLDLQSCHVADDAVTDWATQPGQIYSFALFNILLCDRATVSLSIHVFMDI